MFTLQVPVCLMKLQELLENLILGLTISCTFCWAIATGPCPPAIWCYEIRQGTLWSQFRTRSSSQILLLPHETFCFFPSTFSAPYYDQLGHKTPPLVQTLKDGRISIVSSCIRQFQPVKASEVATGMRFLIFPPKLLEFMLLRPRPAEPQR